MLQLEQQLNLISKLAKLNRLPDAILTDSGLKITPLTNVVPPEIEALVQKIYGLLSHVKITALLLEVDNGQILLNSLPTLKMGLLRKIEYLYCINLGLQRWHICDKTYSAALATLVNAQSITLWQKIGEMGQPLHLMASASKWEVMPPAQVMLTQNMAVNEACYFIRMF